MRALVTGGGGFLGRYIVEKLLEQGFAVRSLARGSYPELAELGVDCVRGDLRDAEMVQNVCKNVELVFHVAATTGMWGKYKTFYSINVTGTENVIAACQAQGVPRLVYTSSPSVVFPLEGLEGVDESQPYPRLYAAHYPKSKAMAEQRALAANSPELATCALRPHLIWGPRDPHLIPMLAQRAERGQLIQIGEGKNLVDITYVENVADAHLQAAGKLHEKGSPVAGNVYFLSDGKPINVWNWIAELLRQLELPPVKKKISKSTGMFIGAVMEIVYTLLPFLGEPRLTRFLVSNFANSYYFDISRARRDFAYAPKIDNEEGLRRTVAWFRLEGHTPRSHRVRPSKSRT